MAHRTVPTAMTSIDDDDDGECQLVSVTNRLPYYVRHLCKSHSHRHKPTSMPIMKTHEPKGVSDVDTLPTPSSEQRIECVHSSCSNVPKTSSVAVFSLSSSSSSSSLSSLSESILSSTIMATRFIPVGHYHDQDATTSEKNHSTNTSNFREQIPLNSYYSSSSSSSSSSSTSSTKKDILPSYKSSNQYLPTVDTLTIEQNLFNMVRFDTVKSNFCDYYQLGNFVRSGGFSDIHEGVRLSDNKPVVVKFIPKDKTKNWLMVSQKKYPAEVLLHKAVHEIQGVIHVYDYFENAQNWILVMERLRHCQDLFDFLESSDRGKLNETTAKKFFQQLVQINLAMFRKGVVHRDLKSENILVDLDTNSLILIDFGASAIFKSSASFYSDFHGTKQYKSPEYILKKRYGGVPSTVWTLGVLLYDMVCGSLPFESEEEITSYKLVLKAHLSSELRNLIQRCLAPNPERRPSLEAILEHPWLKN